VLRQAGLRDGIRVLDLGSGMGDVSLLAAGLVGSTGAVLGIDRATSSVVAARQRARRAGSSNVRFEVHDLLSFTPPDPFDAVVERLVLLYLPNPVAVLRRLCPQLRPGGIVAFLEYDVPQVGPSPPSELFTAMRGLMLEVFTAAGAELEMGSRLHRTFLHAGLPAPEMLAYVPVRSDRGGYEYFVGVLRSLLPLAERAHPGRLAELGSIDTLAERLTEDSLAHERIVFLPRLMGAWSRRLT
jgi:ubiquinone/menaquinone biosynthesis C-methylase UbiE